MRPLLAVATAAVDRIPCPVMPPEGLVGRSHAQRARRTSLERLARRFPGLTRRLSRVRPRLPGAANPTLEQFKAAFLAGNEAFNRQDLRAAFAGLAPDCEWHPFEDMPERVLVGPEQVCRFFEQEIFGTFPDWRSDPAHFLQADDGVFVVLMRGLGTGGASGAQTPLPLAEVWELREGVPVRVREFTRWEASLNAAGLDPAMAGELRRAERAGE